jgi:hypothetical protein
MRKPGAGFPTLRREADAAGNGFVVSFRAYSIKEKTKWN